MYQTPQGREYLLSLEQDAAWISARVLPFLAKGAEEGDGNDPEKSRLAARIIEVRRRGHVWVGPTGTGVSSGPGGVLRGVLLLRASCWCVRTCSSWAWPTRC